ncbi:MAG TPA: thioredoxin domain-containing protein, partial [Holophagaceae bacterium]
MSNRLAGSLSPYLLQHAHNPVDWFPWGEKALAKARAEDKPIFLSIGYSACHWCHVMERESFEHPEVAAVLNAHFVPIKVDREERPDLDDLYMDAVQALTGRGGWPMSVWLTPDLRPFFGGTYFPREARGGMPGFVPLLRRIAELWATQRKDLEDQASGLTAELRRQAEVEGGDGLPDAAVLDAALGQLRQGFDARWGGFGPAPKFPAQM